MAVFVDDELARPVQPSAWSWRAVVQVGGDDPVAADADRDPQAGYDSTSRPRVLDKQA